MKNRIFKIFASLSLSLLLATSVAVMHADAGPTTLLRVNIPFAFQVGGQTLPAGTYRVSTTAPGTLHIQSTDYKQNAMIHAETRQVGRRPVSAKLGFRRSGDRYVLAQVWTPWQGYALRPSRAERKAKQDPSKHLAENSAAELVYVVAQ